MVNNSWKNKWGEIQYEMCYILLRSACNLLMWRLVKKSVDGKMTIYG